MQWSFIQSALELARSFTTLFTKYLSEIFKQSEFSSVNCRLGNSLALLLRSKRLTHLHTDIVAFGQTQNLRASFNIILSLFISQFRIKQIRLILSSLRFNLNAAQRLSLP